MSLLDVIYMCNKHICLLCRRPKETERNGHGKGCIYKTINCHVKNESKTDPTDRAPKNLKVVRA